MILLLVTQYLHVVYSVHFDCAEKLADFKAFVLSDAATTAKIQDLRSRVETFARGFSMPGFDDR